VIGEKPAGRILNKVALGYGQRDDGALGSAEPVKHRATRFRSVQVANERSYDAIAFLVRTDKQKSVEKILLSQRRINELVGGAGPRRIRPTV
jgi:hypothetical protein